MSFLSKRHWAHMRLIQVDDAMFAFVRFIIKHELLLFKRLLDGFLQLLASHSFAKHNKQAGIKNWAEGKLFQSTKILQVQIFTYHFNCTLVIQTQLELNYHGCYNGSNINNLSAIGVIQLLTKNLRKFIPWYQIG